MKLSILPLALACTGLLASASPLRVIVVSNGNGNAPTLHSDSSLVAHLEPPRLTGAVADMKPRPCGGARFRQKVGKFTDSLKIAFGFSVSHNNDAPTKYVYIGKPGQFERMKPAPAPTDNRVHILPFVGTPSQFEGENMNRPHPHRHGHGHRFHHGEQPSFLMRVHFALMSLGPWEGRAVAFVLGCGIGVLLRMFWVLVVISYRVIKGPSSHEDDGYTVIDVDAEEIFVAPPTYTYPVDEKLDVVEPVPVVVVRAEDESK